MKQFFELNYANVFNHKAFMILLVFALKFINIQSFQNLKVMNESNNSYYIIKSDSINYYSNKNLTLVKLFEGDQVINTIGGSEIISFAKYTFAQNISNLVVVKNYIYFLQSRNYICHAKLEIDNEIGSQNETLELIPWYQRSSSLDYYYIVGLLKPNCFEMFLYELYTDNCANFIRSSISLVNVSAVSYQVKDPFGDSSLVLFYQHKFTNHIIAQRYYISSNDNSFEMYSNSVYEHGYSKVKAIKSIIPR